MCYTPLWMMKVLFLFYNSGILLMKGNIETDPSESPTVHCSVYVFTCEFSIITLLVGSQSQSLSAVLLTHLLPKL